MLLVSYLVIRVEGSFVCVRSLCDFLWDTMGLSSTMTLSKHFYTEVVYNDQGEKPQLRWRKIHQDTFEYLVSMRGLNLVSMRLTFFTNCVD